MAESLDLTYLMASTFVTLALIFFLISWVIYATERFRDFEKMLSRQKAQKLDRAITKLSDTELLTKLHDKILVKPGEELGSTAKVANHFASILTNPHKEQFAVAFLNGQHNLIRSEILFEGSLQSAHVYTRDIIARALELNTTQIIVAHNHPSGSSFPSVPDIEVTERIFQACLLFEIKLVDHIVIGNGTWYSFFRSGLLPG